VHGLLHPEMGHVFVPSFDGDTFAGVCPYHGRCFEGVASGPALQERLGHPAEQTSPDDPVWDLEAQYVAAGLLSIVYVLSPRRIVVGGGVASMPGLIDRVRAHMLRLNGRYMARSALIDEIGTYVVPPILRERSGAMGALELARLAREEGATSDLAGFH